ncbi:H(+)/Cl(-) exchange transporter ClcA [Moritella yayanosii]|uniref:H(+)/Cl(-) exchange transporter ClcA n=1 Tax=Moritella yayanosii TaxID=69539 RepID=A0A330LX65_9GAMM|nr:H(+)/Cl(-) exchange transporter ClcA [Moritella yayanosii]SQD80308.1 H(+)/Cl(-) exchange transporter ClcA [Moritella yayanosii]
MPKSPNFRFFQGGLLKHRTTPKLLSTKHDYIVLLALSAGVGALTGLIIALFEAAILWVNAHRMLLFEQLSGPLFVKVLLLMLLGGIMTGFAFWLTRRFAPEASGSGIPHIEGALDGIYDIRWRRVLPVKFIAGTLAIGSGMVLGREGPSIQIGGAIGRMLSDTAKRYAHATHILTAAGAAAGLAAAFNAPLAGILFVIEEMRPQFRYNITSIKCVTLAAAIGTIVMRSFHGQQAVMHIPHFTVPPLTSLWLFLLLGTLFGFIGVGFNHWILSATKHLKHHQDNKLSRIVMTGVLFGSIFTLLQILLPDAAGSGIELITSIIQDPLTWLLLVGLFMVRLLGTVACFASGAPGGVFTPMLTLGTLFGLAYGVIAADLFPGFVAEPAVYAVAGMGALFAATVRAPVTGIILVVEMTDNYALILPLLMTCLGATFIAQALGGKPLYSELLKLSIRDHKAIDNSTT